jgi:hypothetical protein
MQIKFSVEYGYYPLSDENDKKFRGVVWVSLPKHRGEDCVPLYYWGKIGVREIGVDEDGMNTGMDRGNSSEHWVEFHAESFEELNRKIDYAIEEYRKQVIFNIESLQKTREEREIIIDLPDPPYE